MYRTTAWDNVKMEKNVINVAKCNYKPKHWEYILPKQMSAGRKKEQRSTHIIHNQKIRRKNTTFNKKKK